MNKIQKIKISAIAVIMAFICLFSVLQFSYLIDHEKSGTDGFVANNHTPTITADQEVTVNYITGHKVHSLSLLLVPPKMSSDADVVVSAYKSGETDPFFTSHIGSDVYSKGKHITLSFPYSISKGTECRIVITSTETDISKAVSLVYGSATASDIQNWYYSSDLMSGIPAVSLIGEDIKTMAVLIIVLALLVCMYSLISVFVNGRYHMFDIPVKIMDFLVSAGMIAVAVYIIEMLQWGNLLALNKLVILANILLVAGMVALVYVFAGSVPFSAAVAVIVSLLLGTANHYLILFRGTTLLPSDFTGISTAMKVAESYTFEMEDSVLLAIVFIAAAIAFALSSSRFIKEGKFKNIVARVISLALAVVLFVVPAKKPDLFNSEIYLWKQMTGSRTINGFVMNFAINVPLLVREKPENYDVLALKDFVDLEPAEVKANNKAITERNKPNILFIMNESFTDPRTVLDIKDGDKLLPVLDSLKKDSRAFVGQTAVSIFGGGTSCSEYEMLTGFSIRTDNANTAPYLTYFHKSTPSLVWLLNKEGYNTSSYHAASNRNWYRNTAYPNIGFSRTIFLDVSNNTLVDSDGEITGEKLKYKGTYTSFPTDSSGYNIVMDIMKNTDNPVMNFHITMQNHGGYKDDDVVYDYSKDEWSIYLKLMNYSDTQFGEFLTQLENFDEPVVVVFFGDHWSYFDENRLSNAGLSLDTMTHQQITDYYSTPYIVWSNCGYDFSDLPQQTSLSYLSALIMNQLGFDITPWQNFLVHMAEKVPVYSVYNVESNIDQAEYDDLIYRLKCLHYNALNDSSNTDHSIFGDVG